MEEERSQSLKKMYVAIVFLILVPVVALGLIAWTRYLEELSALKHETDRWAAIQDVRGDRIAVETTSDEVWSQLVQMSQNGNRRFVGGIVESYDNKWGFRFKPATLTVADFTAEGLQATISYISENLDYWLDGWAYVSAIVSEVNS